MRTLKAALLAALLLATALSAACSNNDKQAKAQPKRPVPVTVARAEAGAMPVRLQAVGNVEAYQSAAVRSQVGGLIVEQRVRDGQEVAAGEVLFVLDQRPFQAAVKEAQGKLERDQALLKKAEEDLNRYTGLKQKDVVSQQQFDQAQTDAKSLRASIKLSEAQIEQARIQQDYSVIKAPFAGRVGSVLLNVGNAIKANDDRNLLIINQIQPIYVSFSVPEQHLPEIATRMAGKAPLEVEAELAGDADGGEKGKLTAVDNAVDRATGTIKLKALFQNASKHLWPGQFAKVTLNLSNREGVITVPSSAVQQGLQGSFVYVLAQGNTAEFRLVEIGGTVGDRAVVVKGLAPGETVITDGHVRLAPGSLVEVKGQKSQTAEAARPGEAAPGGAPK